MRVREGGEGGTKHLPMESDDRLRLTDGDILIDLTDCTCLLVFLSPEKKI